MPKGQELQLTTTSISLPKFKSPGQAQRLLWAFEPIRGHFHLKQHQLTAPRYREQLRQRFEDWREVAYLNPAA